MQSFAKYGMHRMLAAGAGVALGGAAIAASDPALCEKNLSATGGFDPEALERGAKALREMNNSPHAKKVLELSKTQEETRKQELKTEEAKYHAHMAQQAKEVEQVKWDEQRKTMQQQAQTKAQLAKYEDELARARQQAEHEAARARNAETVKMQEDATARSENLRRMTEERIQAERRSTDKERAELEKEVGRAKALAEAEGRVLEGRQNEDVNRRALLLRLEEERKKAVEVVNTAFGHLGRGAYELVTDRNKMVALAGGMTAMAAGVYGAREGTRVAGRAIDRWLRTPSLVRETSRGKMFGTSTGAAAAGGKMTFRDMVLPPALMENARSLAASTMNTKKHGAPFRHLLMYGPPGTGKTMAAKIMARQSGLDYAIMTGGDVGPLGKDAVTQIHQLFDWSERSSKGVLLFIDEADAFLSKRGADGMSENMRSALNAVLYRTGTQTRDFVLVLATNRPGDLDKAIVDRMDEALHFPLPGADERRHLLELYLGKYILAEGDGADEGKAWSLRGVFSGRKTRSDPILVEGIDDAVLARAAEVTEGFSGRELAKLMASAQAAVHGSPGNVLTVEMFERVVEHKVGEHADKENFGTTSYV